MSSTVAVAVGTIMSVAVLGIADGLTLMVVCLVIATCRVAFLLARSATC